MFHGVGGVAWIPALSTFIAEKPPRWTCPTPIYYRYGAGRRSVPGFAC